MSHRKPASRSAAEINPRQPCPCGSGRRYKSCHGGGGLALVNRPFEGLPSECDWVALRELVPAATASLQLAEDPGRPVTLATVLPGALPALVRAEGQILLGLQVHTSGNDVSRDIAAALEQALAAEPGTMLPGGGLPGPGPRLQDLLTGAALEVAVQQDFGFWLEDNKQAGAEVQAAVDSANAAAFPTVRMDEVDAAYWCQVGGKTHLRWVLPHEEEALLDALARLAAAGALDLGEGSRYAGSLRAHGLLAPVWDLPEQVPAERWQQAAVDFARRLTEALAESGLDDAQRRSRAGLRGRQLTLR